MTAAALLISLLAGQTHLDANPVYRALVKEGVFDGRPVGKLPSPTMPDGLTAAQQREVVEKLAKPRHSFASLSRKSVVSPHLVEMDKVDSGDENRPLQSIHFWFIAHADLEAMSDKDFLDSLLTDDDQTDGVTWSDEQLRARGIELVDRKRERYGQVVLPLLKKVQLRATGRSCWSKTGESILTATATDPRFADDPEFPTRWRPLDREGNAGAPQPYGGAGLYMKITRLHSLPQAVFVECHILGVEPHGWFNGANLLGSKLPPAIQSQVRSARRAMMKATAAE